ncbi:major capsid protein [Variovorax guangxiensis]|uniref:Putative effector of murein hydrolase LrgA (UPF0299 family) n=1 Tax=Variovorax guangxiensis TaxID=1775474 RepID=A0A840FSK9_9BURK|nr:major capsid protein [Variovorax guangxiensis]MBB4225606.1 putative effector of murein hydrolase LrgA (UPF0299 family) [Variovorax guangxiensis]
MNKFAIGQFVSKAKRLAVPGAIGAALGSLMAPVHAAAIDVTDITAGIAEYSGTASPITKIGMAILLVVLTIAAIAWVRRALK